MVRSFVVSVSTFLFKINTIKLIDKQSKMKNTFSSFNFLKTYLEIIIKTCKENASEFK